MELPHMVQDKECGRCIAAAAAEPGGNGNPLVEADVCPLLDLKSLLQEFCGPDDEVAVVRGQHGGDAGELNSAHIVGVEGEPVAQVEHLHDRLNSMISIGSLPQDAQPKIHFGRCSKVVMGGAHGKNLEVMAVDEFAPLPEATIETRQGKDQG